MPLRVHINQQDLSLLAGEKGRKVDGCNRLPATTFLVHDSNRAHEIHLLCSLCAFVVLTVSALRRIVKHQVTVKQLLVEVEIKISTRCWGYLIRVETWRGRPARGKWDLT